MDLVNRIRTERHGMYSDLVSIGKAEDQLGTAVKYWSGTMQRVEDAIGSEAEVPRDVEGFRSYAAMNKGALSGLYSEVSFLLNAVDRYGSKVAYKVGTAPAPLQKVA